MIPLRRRASGGIFGFSSTPPQFTVPSLFFESATSGAVEWRVRIELRFSFEKITGISFVDWLNRWNRLCDFSPIPLIIRYSSSVSSNTTAMDVDP